MRKKITLEVYTDLPSSFDKRSKPDRDATIKSIINSPRCTVGRVLTVENAK